MLLTCIYGLNPLKNKFQEAFSSIDIQNTLNKFESMIQSSDNDVNNLVRAITNVITYAGDMPLLRKRIKRKKTKKHRIYKNGMIKIVLAC